MNQWLSWILTKFPWIYNLDITKNWSDFGDLDLIFKVTTVEKLNIHGWGHLFSLKIPLLVLIFSRKTDWTFHAN